MRFSLLLAALLLAGCAQPGPTLAPDVAADQAASSPDPTSGQGRFAFLLTSNIAVCAVLCAGAMGIDQVGFNGNSTITGIDFTIELDPDPRSAPGPVAGQFERIRATAECTDGQRLCPGPPVAQVEGVAPLRLTASDLHLVPPHGLVIRLASLSPTADQGIGSGANYWFNGTVGWTREDVGPEPDR